MKDEQANATPMPKIFTLRSISTLKNPTLLSYLEAKGICLKIAKQHLKEVIVRHSDTNEEFYTLGLGNEDGGFEVRNSLFKGRVAPHGISVIRGAKPLPDNVHVFKSMIDFLSVLTFQQNKHLQGDAIILHAFDFLPLSLPYIKDYSYRTVHTWFDNDAAGLKAAQALKDFTLRQDRLSLSPMNKIYAGHHDVNAWHRHMLNL